MSIKGIVGKLIRKVIPICHIKLHMISYFIEIIDIN